MIVVWLYLAVPWVCLQFVIVVFPDHTHLLFWSLLCYVVLDVLLVSSLFYICNYLAKDLATQEDPP